MDENSLPATPPPTGTTAVAGQPSESLSPKVKVWLVDDDDEIRRLLAELLSLQGGIECARHFSSPDALLSELASQPGPDVILMDVQMGDRNGLDAVRPIKSLTRSTRVLMFTSCFNPAWQERAFSNGASGYLLKSSPVENVAEQIRCPAKNLVPTPQPRHRSNSSTHRPMPQLQTNSSSDQPLRFLSRTLKKLRLLHN